MSTTQVISSRSGLTFILVSLLTGCASAPQTTQLLEQQLLGQPTGLPQFHELTHVPFYPQKKYHCGPAALAAMLEDSGITISPGDLVPEIYIPVRQGSLQIEILAATRNHGRIAYRIDGNLSSLFKEVSAGNPVLTLQNLGLSWAPTWHYAIVVGFDLTNKKVILRSGMEKRHQTSLDTFEHTWARSDFWGIVVLPPNKLPASANAQRYLEAVAALEKTGHWQAALTAYTTALDHWPDNLIAQMGLGNSYYKLGNLPAAEQVFKSAITTHPDSGIACNNLAQVLFEQGKVIEAKKYVLRAIAMGGSHLDDFKLTLKEINRKSILK